MTIVTELYEQTGGPEPRFRTIVMKDTSTQTRIQISGLFSAEEIERRCSLYLNEILSKKSLDSAPQ